MEAESDRSPLQGQNSQPSFPNSERGKTRNPNLPKKQRSFLREDEGRGCATEMDQIASGRRAIESRGTSKFKMDDDEEDDCEKLQLRANRISEKPTLRILKVLQTSSLSRQVCEAMQQKYRIRLQKGFRTWVKQNKLAKLRPKVKVSDQQQILKSLFDDYFERQKSAKLSAIFKWKCFTKSASQKEQAPSEDGKGELERKNLKKMKFVLVKRFVINRENQMLKNVIHSLSLEAKKAQMMNRERNLRLKFIIKTVIRNNRNTEQKDISKYFGTWKKLFQKPLPLESSGSLESRKNSALINRTKMNIQINYRYSYNKTSIGSGNHSRNGSRGPSQTQPREAVVSATQKQPFQQAPQSLQLGPGGQYRSASSVQSGSRESSAQATGCGPSSQKHSNILGINQRYATRGQRPCIGNESYQDDEDDDCEGELISDSYNIARTQVNVSRESSGLGYVPKNTSQLEAMASRSLEVNPNHHEGNSLPEVQNHFNHIKKNQTQAIKIENYINDASNVDIVDQQPVHGSSPSVNSEEASSNSLINKACIMYTPTDKGDGETSGRLRSSSEQKTSSRDSKDHDQLSKMRNQLRALQREYQKEQDKKIQN